ncbi:MAG: hypothetical protein U5K00_00905 [Melioribacteraceae bacterium]|nr:hypothetical protein [Melioribacteraceae bacterium]
MFNEVKNHFVKHYPLSMNPTSFQGERYYFVSKEADTDIHHSIDSTGELVFFNPDNIDKEKPSATKKKKEKTFDLDLLVTLEDGVTTKKISEIT